MVLALIFRFLIQFQLITVYNVRKGSNFILSRVDRYQLDPALIAKKTYSFPQTCPGILIKKLTDHNYEGLFLDSQLYLTDLYVYLKVSTTQS